MTELIWLMTAFATLLLLGKAAIMGLDDRRSLMLRPIPLERTER